LISVKYIYDGRHRLRDHCISIKVQKCSHVCCNVVVQMLIIINISQDVNFGTVDAGVDVGIVKVCNWIIGDRFFWSHLVGSFDQQDDMIRFA